MSARPGRPARLFRHPAQAVVAGFLAADLLFTGLLWLPIARAGDGGATLLEAFFTATSAVCVTGLAVVDTASYWSGFGEGVILAAIQVGGFGIMTLASLLGLLVARRIGLRTRLTAAAETRSTGLGDVRRVLVGVAKVSLVVECLLALILAVRFAVTYDEPVGRAAYLGVFHSISSFNNAGFALYRDSLVGFAADAWICLPIAAAVIVGGLGYPVLFELRRAPLRPDVWGLHTRITVAMTVLLLVAGTLFITAGEWSNPETLGALEPPGRLLAGFFQAVVPRTAGFNSVDIGQMDPATWLGIDALMFIGGAPASTAGGIKVTTIALLAYVIWAEVRGEPTVHMLDRRIDARAQRQALAVTVLGSVTIVVCTVVLVSMTDLGSERVFFEVISAISTVGMSTGITADFPPAGQVLLGILMFLGRLGPLTLVSALALRERQRLYHLPEGRPLIG